MYFIRTDWLTHGGEKKDFEVYSCHVSPDGQRLVTAAGDGYVRIWSTAAIFAANDADYNEPRQLASMSHHSGTIHTVRFSSSGKYLASGADDKIVCIYVLDPNPPPQATFGSSEAPPVENWRIFRRLVGHDNDVQDLGWSHDSSVLVSVGLDSKVVVWSGHTFEKLKTISSHQSHVKGVTFDPANKYFATAGDDRTIKIFRFTPPGPNATAHEQNTNFVLEKSVAAPFASSPLTTYFRRCSWSPDGSHVAGANAVNGPVSSVAIINRGTWDGDIHLIGHEGPVEVCAFSPRLFLKDKPDPARAGMVNGNHASGSHLTVIACAGQDKALSVWITSNSRPLVIAQDLAVKTLSDIAWSPDGKSLFVTSLDGSIVAVVFEDGELGYPVDEEENEKALAKFGGGRKGAGMVEGPSELLLEELSKEGEIRGAEGRMGALMGDGDPSSVPSVNGTAGTPQPSTTLTNGTGKSEVQLNGSAQAKINGSAATSTVPAKDAQAMENAKLERMKHRVTITKDGKKRIAPLLVSNSNVGDSALPRAQLRAAASGQDGTSDAPQNILDLSKPVDGLPKGGIAALLLGNRRKLAAIEGDEDGLAEKRVAHASRDGVVPVMENTPDGLVLAKGTPAPEGQAPTPDFIRPAVINPALSVSQVRLAVPKVRAVVSQRYDLSRASASAEAADKANGDAQSELAFEARNPTGPSPTGRFEDREPARLAVTRRGQPLWQDFLPKSVLLATGGHRFWAAACEDGSVYAWTSAGRRLLNAVVLESQPVILDSQHAWLLCVTAAGLCYVWNMRDLTAPHPPVSLAPVLDIAMQSLQNHATKAPAVTSARLNSEGRVVVTLTNGDGYAYNPQLFAWQRLSEVWWAVGSQYWNTTDTPVGNLLPSSAPSASTNPTFTNLSAGIIAHLERQTTNEALVRGRAYFLQRLVKQLLPREGYESFESGVSVAHLENRLAAAMLLGARAEFQVHLYMYARRLGAEGLKGKVAELLRGLLGPLLEEKELEGADVGEGDRFWGTSAETLCDWPRRELLKGVVLILGKFTRTPS